MKFKTPYLLLAIYVIVFVWSAINPFDRAVRRAESLPIILVVLGLVMTYRKFQFSNTSYILMSCWILMHTIGSHYTFERVPFDRFNNLFGFERNMYDRVAHTIIGFYAYPITEFLTRKGYIQHKMTAVLFGVFAIGTLAGVYEIIEMIYAITAGGSQGAAFLGSQGDIWDAQKDIACDLTGAIAVGILFLIDQFKVSNT